MRYETAPDLQARMVEIVNLLNLNHIDLNRVVCLRSFGSSSRRIIARCHALGKLLQKAMGHHAFYAIEFLERFDKMSKQDKDKVIIHELLHIPKSFGGGFRQHDFVCEKNVNVFYGKLLSLELTKEDSKEIFVEKESPSKISNWSSLFRFN